EIFHLLIRQFPETQQHNHEVCRLKMLHSWDIFWVTWCDGIGGWIDRKQHRGLETIALGENPRQHGHPLFRTVFIISADQYNMLSFSGTRFSLILDPLSRILGIAG